MPSASGLGGTLMFIVDHSSVAVHCLLQASLRMARVLSASIHSWAPPDSARRPAESPGCWYMHDPAMEVCPSSLHVSHEPSLSHDPSLMYKQLASLSHALCASAAVL